MDDRECLGADKFNRCSPNSVDLGEGVHVVNPESLKGDKMRSTRIGRIGRMLDNACLISDSVVSRPPTTLAACEDDRLTAP